MRCQWRKTCRISSGLFLTLVGGQLSGSLSLKATALSFLRWAPRSRLECGEGPRAHVWWGFVTTAVSWSQAAGHWGVPRPSGVAPAHSVPLSSPARKTRTCAAPQRGFTRAMPVVAHLFILSYHVTMLKIHIWAFKWMCLFHRTEPFQSPPLGWEKEWVFESGPLSWVLVSSLMWLFLTFILFQSGLLFKNCIHAQDSDSCTVSLPCPLSPSYWTHFSKALYLTSLVSTQTEVVA